MELAFHQRHSVKEVHPPVRLRRVMVHKVRKGKGIRVAGKGLHSSLGWEGISSYMTAEYRTGTSKALMHQSHTETCKCGAGRQRKAQVLDAS